MTSGQQPHEYYICYWLWLTEHSGLHSWERSSPSCNHCVFVTLASLHSLFQHSCLPYLLPVFAPCLRLPQLLDFSYSNICQWVLQVKKHDTHCLEIPFNKVYSLSIIISIFFRLNSLRLWAHKLLCTANLSGDVRSLRNPTRGSSKHKALWQAHYTEFSSPMPDVMTCMHAISSCRLRGHGFDVQLSSMTSWQVSSYSKKGRSSINGWCRHQTEEADS